MIAIIVIIFATLLAVYDKNIVHALEPAATKLKESVLVQSLTYNPY